MFHLMYGMYFWAFHSLSKLFTFIFRDIGGQHRIRTLWRHYYEGTDGMVYVFKIQI